MRGQRQVPATRRTQAAVGGIQIEAEAEDRTRALADRFAQITSGAEGIAFTHAIAIEVREELILVERNVIVIERVAADQRAVFGQRHARPQRETCGRLLEGRVPVIPAEIEAVVIAPIDIDARRNVAVEQIGFGEAGFRRTGVARVIYAETHSLAAPAEIALADGAGENEVLDRGEARRQLQFAGRLLFDIGFEHDPVGGAAFDLIDFQAFLEEPQ